VSKRTPISNRRHAALSVSALAFAAGGVDAGVYLGLGHAFPANMTGNTVLLAIAAARGAGSDALRSAVALGGFSIGVLVGAQLIAEAGQWPATAARAFALEFVAIAAVLVAWIVLAPPTGVGRYLLLASAGLAMGVQSAATRSAKPATPYVTGTLTTALMGLSGRDHQGALSGEAWLLYGIGALCAALIELSWSAGALLISTLLVGAVSLGARRAA
jgi:uncharacterized membrane protein YoaK (UPF0700 family)